MKTSPWLYSATLVVPAVLVIACGGATDGRSAANGTQEDASVPSISTTKALLDESDAGPDARFQDRKSVV